MINNKEFSIETEFDSDVNDYTQQLDAAFTIQSETDTVTLTGTVTQTTSAATNVLVKENADITAASPAAVKIVENGKTVTLESSTLRVAGIPGTDSSNSVILFGTDASFWDPQSKKATPRKNGTVTFTGKTISLLGQAGGGTSAAGIRGKDLTINFEDDADGSKDIRIGVSNGGETVSEGFGIGADGTLTVNGNFAGKIGLQFDFSQLGKTLQSGVSGLYAKDDLDVNGDLSGLIGVSVFTNSRSTAYGLYAGKNLTVSGKLNGIIAALSEDKSVGIYGEQINVTITGTVFAGTSIAGETVEDFSALLANPGKKQKELEERATGTAILSTGKSSVKIKGDARIYGDVILGGNSYLSLNGDARIYGDVTLGTQDVNNVYISLRHETDMPIISGNCNLGTEISVDFSKAVNGRYVLANNRGNVQEVWTRFVNSESRNKSEGKNSPKVINLPYDGPTVTWHLEEEGLVFTVTNSKNTDEEDTIAPIFKEITPVIKGNQISFSTDMVEENTYLYSLQIRLGESPLTLENLLPNYGNGDYIFTNVPNGKYYYQLQAIDVYGNASEWTDIQVLQVGPVCVEYTVPQAEYMYGCTATVMGMLLGYYDRYGYMGYDVSNLIDGKIELNARGLDGNMYNMNAFDSILGSAIASEDYVQRFYEKTPAEEYTWMFKEGTTEFNTSVWNCIADYLGTGQYWRGAEDLATLTYYLTLDELMEFQQTFEITSDNKTVSLPIKYQDLLYGTEMYVQDKGYALDAELTRTVSVDCDGGTFTFEDFQAEIDAGRLVVVHIEGHSMLGYGYDKETNEIIFDDTYHADQRMKWNGTYMYSDKERKLKSVSVFQFDTSKLEKRPDVPAPVAKVSPAEWTAKTVTVTAEFTEESVLNEYSLNGFDWLTYAGGITVSDNSSVYFRSMDEIGRYSAVTEYKVTNIDKIAPQVTISNQSLDWTTDKALILLQGTDDESGISALYYSLDNRKTWLLYDPAAGITVTGNGTLFAKAVDNVGNETIEQLKIDKIDGDKPVISVKGNAASLTNKDVILTISAADAVSGVRQLQVSLDGTAWTDCEDPEKSWQYTVSQNGTVFIKAVDWAGNIAETQITVDKIDKVAPAISVASNNSELPTGRVILTASAGDDIKLTSFKYSLDNKKWKTYTAALTITSNQTVYFKAVDSAGNVTIEEFEVKNIQKLSGRDTTPPAKVTGIKVKEGADQKKTVISWIEPVDNVYATNYEVIIDGKKTYKTSKTQITIEGLSAGEHTVAVVALDKAKNRSDTSDAESFTVKDITAPKKGKITFYQLDKDRLYFGMKNFSDNVDVEKYLIYKGSELLGETTSTFFITEQPDIAGKHTFKVVAVDAAGNRSKAVSKKVTIKDVTAPEQVTGLTVKEGASQKSVKLSWNAAADNVKTVSYKVIVNGKSYTTKTNSLTIKGLSAGDKTFTVIALDKAKNQSIDSESMAFSVADITAPKAGKISLSQKSTTQVQLSFKKFSDNVGVVGYNIYLNGELVATTENTTYFYDFQKDDLAGKTVKFTVKAVDAAGNESKSVKKSLVLKDMTAPGKATELSASTEGKVTTLTWAAADDNMGVTSYTIKVNGKKYTSKTNSLVLKNLKAGLYTFNVTAKDKAKNTGETSEDYKFGVGFTLPESTSESSTPEVAFASSEDPLYQSPADPLFTAGSSVSIESLTDTENDETLPGTLAGVL